VVRVKNVFYIDLFHLVKEQRYVLDVLNDSFFFLVFGPHIDFMLPSVLAATETDGDVKFLEVTHHIVLDYVL